MIQTVELAHPIITGFWLSIGYMLPGIILSGIIVVGGIIIKSLLK